MEISGHKVWSQLSWIKLIKSTRTTYNVYYNRMTVLPICCVSWRISQHFTTKKNIITFGQILVQISVKGDC